MAQPKVTQLSVQVAASKVIDELKKFKRGLTEADIEKKAELRMNPALREYLLKNEFIEFNDNTSKFVYKFKYNINDKQDLLNYLKDPPTGLLIADDVESSYDSIEDDIKEMREELQILIVPHATRKKNVLFKNPFENKLSADIPLEIPAEVKSLWINLNILPDYIALRQYLKSKGIKLATLDCTVHPEEARKVDKKEDKKRVKRKRTKAPKDGEASLAALAQQINFLGGDTSDERTLKLNQLDMDDEEDGNGKKSILYHNMEANPEEFGYMEELVQVVGHWFYDDQYLAILDSFLKQRVHKETDLSKQMALPQKQVGGLLTKLNSHKLLTKTVCEAGARGTFNAFDMDLDKFTNVIQYRLCLMEDNLQKEIDDLSQAILVCPNESCKKRYTALDLPKLYFTGSGYMCSNSYCRGGLTQVDGTLKQQKQELLDKVKAELQPLKQIIAKLIPSGKEEKVIPSQVIRRTTGPRRPFGAGTRRGKGKDDEKVEQADAPATESALKLMPLEPKTDFDVHPIWFSSEKEVFVPIVKKWPDLKANVALRLAKHVLNEVGEFQFIVNACVYIYKLTEHSLYLAWTRGYSPNEVVRLLKLLSKNPMPMIMEKNIREQVNGNKFYRASMTLRNGQYCVQSKDRDVLKKMLDAPSIKDMAPVATRFEEVSDALRGTRYNFAILPGEGEKLKRNSTDIGHPLIDEFDFLHRTEGETFMDVNIKSTKKVRSYQNFAMSRIFWNGFRCHSGILVLPCGAGKTLIGTTIIATVKRPTIIFCQSVLAVKQWKEHLIEWTTLPPNEISRFSSKHPTEWKRDASVVITTYPMFSSNPKNRAEDTKKMMAAVKQREWGLLVLDEVHLVPAKVFRKVTNQIRCHVKIGLTATMVREDGLIDDLVNLVGPKLYELDIFTLRMHNYIAPVECQEISCPMTQFFKACYDRGSNEERRLLYSTNPNKTRVVASIVKHHLAQKQRIMVFCDNLFCLNWYTQMLKKPKIDGSTPIDDRFQILQDFRKAENGGCMLISQVGDQSIDLPEAEVVIQVALMHGGRMQEGQRIGRIQRPQKHKPVAYFYSLISQDTVEVQYADARRKFLQDHGYIVKRTKGDGWIKHLTEDTANIISKDIQEGLLDLIRNEMMKKEQLRTRGEDADEPEEEAHVDAAQKRGTKRKAGPSTAQSIDKKLKSKHH